MEQGSSCLFPVPAVAELQAQVVEALTPLGLSIPSLDRFTVQSILDINLTVGDFCSALRPLQSLASQGILDRVIAFACLFRVISCVSVTGMQTRDLYQISQWVNTAAGKEDIANITATPKPEKRVRHDHDQSAGDDKAWISIFNAMQTERNAMVKSVKIESERKKAELRKQIEALEMAKAAELAELVENSYPAQAKFVPIEKQDLIDGSWNAYVNDCHLKGILAKPRDDHFEAPSG